MKQFRIFILTLLACWGAESVKAQSVDSLSQGTPCLELIGVEHDFGEVDRRGGDLHLTLSYRNVGGAPLVLTRVITSCSCLKAHYSKRPLSAGQEAQIELIYQPLKAAPGTFHKVVQILSNSSTGRQMFVVRGNSVDTKANQHEKKK